MLQSPAPALIKMEPPLSGPSMKARSLMVPSCMLNSRSGPLPEANKVRQLRHNLNLTVFYLFYSKPKHYLWRCSCLHWKAALWQTYHWSRWPTVVHSGSRPRSRWSPCGVCSSWSEPPAAWLQPRCWMNREARHCEMCSKSWSVKFGKINIHSQKHWVMSASGRVKLSRRHIRAAENGCFDPPTLVVETVRVAVPTWGSAFLGRHTLSGF